MTRGFDTLGAESSWLPQAPTEPIQVEAPEGYHLAGTDQAGPVFRFAESGTFRMEK